MRLALTLLAITAVVVGGAAVARRYHRSAPLMLCVVGIAVSFIPGLGHLEVDREVVLLGLLPPLLYFTAIRTSPLDIRANIRSIALLSVGLVLFTAVGVGLLVWWLLDIPFAIALAVGAVVAPPDAVAATAVARRIGLPRRVVTVLEGESLFNDATALVTLRMAILAAGASVTVFQVAANFVWAAVGGIAIGVVTAKVLMLIRRRVTDVLTDTALSLMTPWLAFLPAELAHASGVVAVVVAGLLLGHKAPLFQQPTARQAERTYMATVQFLLENAVFLLIGLQAKSILDDVTTGAGLGLGRTIWVCLLVFAAVVLLRPIWVFPASFVVDSKATLNQRMRTAGVLSWAGMRGVVTLAAAFTLPEDAPHRGELVLMALVVTAGTLLLQGSTLPLVARALKVHGPDPREDALQLANVMQRAAAAGDHYLQKQSSTADKQVVHQIRQQAEMRTHLAWERLGTPRVDTESPLESYRRLRAEMLQAERAEVLRLRDSRTIDNEVILEALDALDLEESMLTVIEERNRRYSERTIVTPERVAGNCDHLRSAPAGVEPRNPEGCEDCRREGTKTVNLRLCLTCGTVACCDSSPGRHAERHFRHSGHPVIRSFEPGEAWRWCYVESIPG